MTYSLLLCCQATGSKLLSSLWLRRLSSYSSIGRKTIFPACHIFSGIAVFMLGRKDERMLNECWNRSNNENDFRFLWTSKVNCFVFKFEVLLSSYSKYLAVQNTRRSTSSTKYFVFEIKVLCLRNQSTSSSKSKYFVFDYKSLARLLTVKQEL